MDPRITVTIDVEGEPHEVEITMSQALALMAVKDVIEVERWHMCVNGCCVIIHEVGFDEYAWFIIEDGTVEKIDRYGNVLEVIE